MGVVGVIIPWNGPLGASVWKIGPALGVSDEWLFYGTEGEMLSPHPTEGRLAAAQAELRHLREMVAELREDRDAWRAQAERLAGKLKP